MRIICMGDSIMQYNDYKTYPQFGWVQILPRFFPLDTVFFNFARNGRSTKSFISEGRFGEVCAAVQKGDFVLIQFGHNDEKSADPNRYTSPDKDGEYRKNIVYFVTELRKLGAYPILLTPVARRKFNAEHTMEDTHGAYPEAMKSTAAELNVPCVDLNALTFKYFEQKGLAATRSFFMNFDAGEYDNFPDGRDDNSHLRADGAFVVSKIAAGQFSLIGKKYPDYKQFSSSVLIEPADRDALEKEVSDEFAFA